MDKHSYKKEKGSPGQRKRLEEHNQFCIEFSNLIYQLEKQERKSKKKRNNKI